VCVCSRAARTSQTLSSADAATVDAALVCLLYAVRVDNARADALVIDLRARGMLRCVIDALALRDGRAFGSALLVLRRLLARDAVYALLAAALEREHAAPERWLGGEQAQSGDAAVDEDDCFLWPLTDRSASLVEVLAAAVSAWVVEDAAADPALTLVPLRSSACLATLLRSVRRRLTLLATGGTTGAEPMSVAMARGASFCAHLCELVASVAADAGEWQSAMTRSPDVCNSLVELLRVVEHVEQRVSGASFGGVKRELLRAIANLLAGRDKLIADHIAVVGGVELLLSNTRLSDTNPYASQWAIVALRYACELSESVRNLIGELKRDAVVSNDALDSQGGALRVQVQHDGKIKLSRS
jgi:hypothetical protein